MDESFASLTPLEVPICMSRKVEEFPDFVGSHKLW
jgi:hypothetical protein